MSQSPAKQSSGTSSKVLSKFIAVYNNTVGILDCNIFTPNPNPKLRQIRTRVKFMPGNNKVSRDDWAKCLENETFVHWTKEQTMTTPGGHEYPLTLLEAGKKVDHSKELSIMERKIQTVRENMDSHT